MNKKQALATSEIAVAVGLAAVIVVLVVGMFTDGLNGLMAKNSITKMFIGNDQKTEFSSYERNYSSSQIAVQITGAQGLEMLRKKANNMALDLLKNDPKSKANELAYLSKAVEIISGEQHFCAYMTINSKKHCDKISSYTYKNTISNALVMNKVGGSPSTLPLNTAVSSIVKDVVVPKDSNGNSSYEDNEEAYMAISELTASIRKLKILDPSVLLTNETGNFKNVKKAASVPKDTYVVLFEPVTDLLETAQEECECSIINDVPNVLRNNSNCGKYRLTKSKSYMRKDHRYVSKGEIKDFNNILRNIKSDEELAQYLNPKSALAEVIRQDNWNKKMNNKQSSCDKFNEIVKNRGLTPFECKPYRNYSGD